jgi:hypothetical protein
MLKLIYAHMHSLHAQSRLEPTGQSIQIHPAASFA